MDANRENEAKVERTSEREVVVTRTINAPAQRVFDAWTQPDIFRRWWVPQSYGLNLVSCEMDVRVGGEYRLGFLLEGSIMEFFGTYVEVTPHSRLVWTNDEDGHGQTITTVTFEENEGKTLVTVHDKYPSPDAVETGSSASLPESLGQLEELLGSE